MTTQSSFEKELREHGTIVWPNVGHSMEPLIRQGRDMMVIERRPQTRLKRFDVVLYHSGSRYILHRILRVRRHDYVICGDNCIRRESGITDDMIIGVLKELLRDGRTIPLKGIGYWCYTRLWCGMFHLKAAVIWSRSVVKSLWARIIRRQR